MMCAVTLSLYRSLPTLSIIHVYYSCRISRQADNGLVSPLDYADQRPDCQTGLYTCGEMYRASR